MGEVELTILMPCLNEEKTIELVEGEKGKIVLKN